MLSWRSCRLPQPRHAFNAAALLRNANELNYTTAPMNAMCGRSAPDGAQAGARDATQFTPGAPLGATLNAHFAPWVAETKANAPTSASERAAQGFAAWLRSAAGERLLAVERPCLRESVRRFHGEAALWIGTTPQLLDTTERCMVRERFYATCCLPGGSLRRGFDSESACGDFKAVRALPAKLPFPSASVDGVVLHHALETEDDRRGALRDAARVLRPGGRLLLVGVNPSSLWLFAKPFAALRDLKPVSVPRLQDWLALLGLEQDAKTRYLNYRSVLPFALRGKAGEAASSWLNRLQAPVGGVYLISATKVAAGHITQRGQMKAPAREAQPTALPNPATRQ